MFAARRRSAWLPQNRISRTCGPPSSRVRSPCCYVFDPGPDGSLGDIGWVIDAKKAGRLPALLYQGVQATDLAKVADVVLPGAAWVEKDATYTNETGSAAGRIEGHESTR